MKSALIIGGGFAGCAAAHQFALMGGWDVTLVETMPYLGAGVRTRYYGGHPYTFGPRHFLTPMEHVFSYVNDFVPMRRCQEHEFLTFIEQDNRFYHYPIHRDDIGHMPEAGRINEELAAINFAEIAKLSQAEREKMGGAELRRLNGAKYAKNFEEFWLYSIGRTLYGKFVEEYSKKMWMIESNTQIDDFLWSPKGVEIKEGDRKAWDASISAYPKALNGYDDYFDIATAKATVLLSTAIESYDIPKKTVVIKGEKRKFDVIVNTISPDLLFEKCFGELPYVGREIFPIVLPVEFVMPPNVFFCYYAGRERFTRIVEYKKFTLYQAPTTLITLEIPSRANKHYPMPFEAEKSRARQYFELMPENVFSIGRAGSYLYNVDIDNTIEHAMGVADKLKS
jgi:UDP-galactopyranose mutase